MSSVWRRVEALLVIVVSFTLAALVIRYRVQVEAYLGSIGLLAYPIAVLVFVVVASAPFSVTDALAIMNGVLFGPWKGAAVNAVGIVLAAIAGYAIARKTSQLVDIEQNLERLPKWVRHFRLGSPGFLLAVRIIPGLGGTVATNVAAKFRVPLFVHVWTMSLIAIPICTLLAIFGDRVGIAVHDYYDNHVQQHIPHLHRHKPVPK